ncbi:MAG: FMN-binding protein [Ignavibacteriae bacterium]|nr:FMN-binding protein [Ignavibacteriota bacterium]NOG98700.1 FMN-binding protein [Ignavibacteriota bacterium]
MKILLILLILIINFAGTICAGEIKDRSEEIINSTFSGPVFNDAKKFMIPVELLSEVQKKCKQKFYKNYVYYWKIEEAGSLKAIAVLDNVYGKSMPITFMVIFDLDGKIIRSEIVKYREQYGGGVSSDQWNEQFKNKNSESSFNIGSDIAAISGATISVNSVTKGIRKLTLIFNSIKNSL